MSEPGERMPEPDEREHVAGQLAEQARACAAMGSPLYGQLLQASARDCREGGAVWQVLSHHVLPGRGNAVALRFMAAVHRLVLTRRAPELALHYPSVGGQVGGQASADTAPVFLATVADHADELIDLVALGCQTNEVGRCAPLAWGFLHVGQATGLPLRCLEVGASAGLNLRWDAYHYGGGGTEWGPVESSVDLAGLWSDAPQNLPEVAVVERRGCDLAPLDPTTTEGRLALSAAVWADMTDRFDRLHGAFEIAGRVPVTVDAEGLDTWTARHLASPQTGVATVVFHSVVSEYVPPAAWENFHATVERAGAQATPDAPLAWVRLEPVSALRRHGVSVTLWPGGHETVLATSGPHGQDVRAVAADDAARTVAAGRAESRRISSLDTDQ